MPKFAVAFLMILPAASQSLGGAGTLRGTVRDSSGAPILAATVTLSHAVNGHRQQVLTAGDGAFALHGIAPSTYRLAITASSFAPYLTDITIRSAIPIEWPVTLEVAAHVTTVDVSASSTRLVENKPASSDTVDRHLLASLPTHSPDSGLNDAIMLTTAGIAADSNGFFHPLGDHAQVSYVIDGQPVNDQRNKVFSTSIPANAIQQMELISGSPNAEYGDKTSLVINATTRSGLGRKPAGTFGAAYGTFGTIAEETTLEAGTARLGNFLAANAERSGRFLDTPEFRPMHATGNTATIFDRIDLQPSARHAFHLDLLAARNWFQVPNTYDQPQQDQRQKVVSYNVAPSWQRTLGEHALLSLNGFMRADSVDYYPSRDRLHDSPATLAQHRTLGNHGLHANLSAVQGRHNWKAGVQAAETRLHEEFDLALTDPAYNSPCLQQAAPALREPAQCASAGLLPDPSFLPSLLPYDLSRGGRPFHFLGRANIRQFAAFAQDTITFGNLTLSLGLRYDVYRGLTSGNSVQPRAAFSYLLKATNTVIRAGYSHTMETPTNENLVVSSSTGAGGLAGNLFQDAAAQRPIALGSRNQYDAGLQQSLSPWVLLDISYFRKYTRNAFDFDALFSTPVLFPIGWKQSKIDGVAARITTVEFRGFRAFATMGHANARFFGPEVGGIIFNANLTVGAYRQDHDQVYQQNLDIRYQPRKQSWWMDFNWRYDSGLVVGAVNGLQDALTLTAGQQSAIGFYCGAEQASLTHRIETCASPDYGATRIRIPAADTQNADHNPPRTRSRHILNASVGNDALFRTRGLRTGVNLTVMNLTNRASLYNFLSPFSGTHWVSPRTVRLQLAWSF